MMSALIDEMRAFWDGCFQQAELPSEVIASSRVAVVIDFLKRWACHTVLDVGCGLDRWSVPLAKAGFSVKAVDISPEAIRLLEQWVRREELSIASSVCAAQQLATLGGPFDAVICNSVLDHMPIKEALSSIGQIEQVLRVHGVAYLSFDGLEESEETTAYDLLPDGTRRYVSGRQKGMLWRFYTDSEIRSLCKNMDIRHFAVEQNGRRELWVYNKSSR